MTTQLPKVSIAIITYNQEDFIEEAVRSAADQDYENLEVVVADDGSTDHTPDILKTLKREYGSRLVLNLGGPNVGISGNTNRALRMCSGEYICTLGGDDVLLQGKVKTQLAFMINNPECILSYHQVEVFKSGHAGLSHYFTSKFLDGDADTLIEHGMFFLPIAVMFKNGYLPQDPTDDDIPRAGDWMLYIDLLHYSDGKIMYMPGVYARYRRHSHNITNIQNFDESWLAFRKMLIKMPQRSLAIRKSMARQAISDFYSSPKNFRRLSLTILTDPIIFISKISNMLFNSTTLRRNIKLSFLQKSEHAAK